MILYATKEYIKKISNSRWYYDSKDRIREHRRNYLREYRKRMSEENKNKIAEYRHNWHISHYIKKGYQNRYGKRNTPKQTVKPLLATKKPVIVKSKDLITIVPVPTFIKETKINKVVLPLNNELITKEYKRPIQQKITIIFDEIAKCKKFKAVKAETEKQENITTNQPDKPKYQQIVSNFELLYNQ